VSLTYKEHVGGHEWDFWDWAMKQFLDWWIPEDAGQGVSSGNVKS
jgi:acetyl esterase